MQVDAMADRELGMQHDPVLDLDLMTSFMNIKIINVLACEL